MISDSSASASLGDPLKLRCGAIIKNLIAKAAMSDSLGDRQGDATEAQVNLYAHCVQDGVGYRSLMRYNWTGATRRYRETDR